MAYTTGEEFLFFSFGNFDSKNKNIYRVINGDRYNEHLAPQLQDKTAEVPGGDGQYFFGTHHKSKVFDVEFAFEDLKEADVRELKQIFSGKEIKELVFSERDDRVYIAKVTGQPILKYIPFDGADGTIYKGEGTVQFTAYWPYAKGQTGAEPARSPENGKYKNEGDIPAPFILTYDDTITPSDAGTTFTVGELSITVCKTGSDSIDNLTWDSKTGVVSTEVDGKSVAILYTGNSLGAIPVDGIDNPEDNIKLNGGTLKYHYWYY